jgi:hypothetical protein
MCEYRKGFPRVKMPKYFYSDRFQLEIINLLLPLDTIIADLMKRLLVYGHLHGKCSHHIQEVNNIVF